MADDHKQALTNLLKKVEENGDTSRASTFVKAFEPLLGYDAAINSADLAIRAHRHGALDAAKALHEELLPEWEWGKNQHGIWVSQKQNRVGFYGVQEYPARAWLIAILKALIAKEYKEPRTWWIEPNDGEVFDFPVEGYIKVQEVM